jgi:flagellar basal body-associated protein FliL
MEAKSGNNKLMMFIIIFLLILLLGSIVFVSITLIRSLGATQETTRVDDQTFVDTPPLIPEPTTLTPSQIAQVSTGDPFIHRVQSTSREEHIIRVGVVVGVDNTDSGSADLVRLISDSEVIVRDLILGIINNSYFEDLNRPDGMDHLKGRILRALQLEFASNLIYQIYFTEWVIR